MYVNGRAISPNFKVHLGVTFAYPLSFCSRLTLKVLKIFVFLQNVVFGVCMKISRSNLV